MSDRNDDVDDRDDENLDDEDELIEPADGRSGTLSFMAGMVLGALVGAAVALLVAPDRGVVTRKRLKKAVARMRHDAGERMADWRDDVKAELKRRRRQIREQIER